MMTIDEATATLLAVACEYGRDMGTVRDGDIIAAALRLGAAKLRDGGSELHARDLENAATLAEKTP